ncbi:MAG: rod shape-determining protein RodA [Bdellovibrionales bacterium]|nr:rod shape-determining protein RodA [Bdellovibrionales bacterium]
MFIDRRLIKQFDLSLFFISLLIPCLGLIVLYSAGYSESANAVFNWIPAEIKSPAFVKQAMFIGAGLLVMLVAISIPSDIFSRYAYLLYFIGICLLLVVLVAGVVSHGSRRWLAIGGFTIQPSELVKFSLILALSKYLSSHPPGPGGYGFKQLFMPLMIILFPTALIIKQPDLGTAISVAAIGVMMVLFMGVRIKCLSIIAATGLAAIYPAWLSLHDYQKRRVLALINPDADPLGSGYHIIQSKIAVGSGGFFGKGFMGGTQTQLEFLPEHTTDFVFSVLAEEWGFIGAVIVLSFYFLFLYKILSISVRSKDLFSVLVVFGIAASFFFHVIVNVGMVIGILPVVGLPLPLFSYGGSSVLSSMFAIGIVQGVTMRRLIFAAKS